MAQPNSILSRLLLVLLCILYQTDARPIGATTKIPILARQEVPPICERSSLEPAVDCGCYIYYPLYSNDEEWQFLEDICLEELSGRIATGERRCSASPYGRGFGSSIRGRVYDQITNRANSFFRNARRQCTHFEASTSSTYDEITNGGYTTTTSSTSSSYTGSSYSYSSIVNGSGTSRQANDRSRLAEISGDDLDSSLRREAAVHDSEASSESAVVIRSVKGSAKNKIVDFCETVLYYKRYSRIERQKKCRGKK